ncbi:phospholipid carrier-dependent glycosyltransferase [Candidatus Microgenomates bacterium]|nr:MAG: phospholipid carrier-dependent glycosyltransferase [Candidatus Microgenomates bacterium]
MQRRFLLLFLCVFLFSAFIRLYVLTQNPEGFDPTEAAFAYNAYSILQTGRDEDGRLLPLVLISTGDDKLTGYSYWQIPFIALLGLNEFSARFSTAFAGILSLLLIYFIVHEVFKNKKLALLTVFLVGISPWHLTLSRMAYDPMIALVMYLASIAAFLHWQKMLRTYALILSGFTLAWSLGTYYAVWLLLPFTLLYYAFHIFKNSGSFQSKLSQVIVIAILPLVTIGAIVLVTQGNRLNQDSTFQVHAQPLLDELIREDQHEFAPLMTRAFHNKAVFYPQMLLQSYFTNLSFDFLFLNGDKIDRRFWVPYQGVLLLWMAPFVLLGILQFWKKQSLLRNILVWGAIGVIFLGSAFSEFGSESERTLFAIPLFAIFTSFGLLFVYQQIRGRRLLLLASITLGVLLGFNVAYFNHQYYHHANVHEPWGRNYGTRALFSRLPQVAAQYEQVVIPDSLYIFYYFYNQTDPHQAWKEAESRLVQGNFLNQRLRKQVGPYVTMPIDCPRQGKKNTLYVCFGNQIPQNSQVVDVTYYRDGQPAITLLELTQEPSNEPPPKNIDYGGVGAILDANDTNFW